MNKKTVQKPELSKEAESRLIDNLVKLGDMIGDGLADEPDGRWIKAEYRKTLKALGMAAPRANNSAEIDDGVKKYLETNRCPRCQGELKQTRAGALRLTCQACSMVVQLKRAKKKPST